MTHLRAAALRYAADGWPVFLLGRTKRPVANCDACKPVNGTTSPHDPQACTCLLCHGFYAATRDPKTIARMLALVPGGLLAIRTGTASGLVVIDIDPRNGGTASLATLRQRVTLPPTRYVRTGNRGWHLYYRYPRHTRVSGGRNQLGQGIDVKADGGYVVAPPSVHPLTRQPYTWADPDSPISEMPPALIAACLQADPRPAAPATPCPAPTLTARGGISSPAALLAAHLDSVRRAPEGRRRVTLYGSARGVARMVAAGAISATDAHAALLEVGLAAGQTERDTCAAIAGGFRDEGVTL